MATHRPDYWELTSFITWLSYYDPTHSLALYKLSGIMSRKIYFQMNKMWPSSYMHIVWFTVPCWCSCHGNQVWPPFQMHAQREEHYLMLQKHREQLRMDKYLLSEHEREHGRLTRIGTRSEPASATVWPACLAKTLWWIFWDDCRVKVTVQQTQGHQLLKVPRWVLWRASTVHPVGGHSLNRCASFKMICYKCIHEIHLTNTESSQHPQTLPHCPQTNIVTAMLKH